MRRKGGDDPASGDPGGDYRQDMGTNPNRSARQALRRAAPWVAIAVLIAVTQVIRTQWAAAGLFLIVAVALAVDAAGGSPRRSVRWRPGRLATAIIVLVAGVVLCLAPRYSTLMGVGLTAVGLLALPFAWADPDVKPAVAQGSDRAMRRSALAWALTLVVVCVCELATFVFGRVAPQESAEFPSISMVVDPFLHQPWPRAVFILGWLAVGLLLVRPAAHQPLGDAATRGQAGGHVHRTHGAG